MNVQGAAKRGPETDGAPPGKRPRVCPTAPVPPASLVDLPLDALASCMGYVGVGSFRYVAEACGALRTAYLAAFPGPEGRVTDAKAVTSSIATFGVWESDRVVPLPTSVSSRRLEQDFSPAAASNGSLDVLQLLRSKYQVPFAVDWIRRAAQNGHIDVCKWIRSCISADAWRGNVFGSYRDACIEVACENQHWGVMKWALDDYNEIDGSDPMRGVKNALYPLGKFGDSKILLWCIDRKLPMHGVIRGAASNGRLDLLGILHNRGLLRKGDWGLHVAAASHGRIDVFEWAKHNGLLASSNSEIRVNPNDDALRNGHKLCALWLRDEGFEWSSHLCKYAAARGHLDTLKWLRARGCPWDYTTLTSARNYGHDEIYQWAVANGCPGADENF